MRLLTGLIATMLLLFPSCASKEAARDDGQSLMDASRRELAAALEERDQLLHLVTDITATMDQIRYFENVMSITASRSNENKVQRAQLLSDIMAVRNALKHRREQLNDMEAKLEGSTLYTEELRNAFLALRRQIDSQSREINEIRNQLVVANDEIESLCYEVDSLNTAVDSVSRDLSVANATSQRLETELNTCYYVVASKSQLKAHNVIETRFLRDARLVKGDFDLDFFTIGDKRVLDSLSLGCGRFRMYTNHPDDSYTVIGNGREKVLVIVSAEKFWSISNFLVVQTD